MAMKILNANKIFDMDLVSHYFLCFDLLFAVEAGAGILRLSEHDKEYCWINDDGEKQSWFPVKDEAFWTCTWDRVTKAVVDLSKTDGMGSNADGFLLAIGDHTIRVTVDEMAVDSPRSISLSMDGMKPARERARGLLHEIIDDEKHRPMILSYDGRILGHGTLKLRHRIAELMNWVAVFVWFVGWVGLTCAIYAVSPLGMALGIWGWLPCVLLGLLLALSFAPHVFARPEVESSESTFS